MLEGSAVECTNSDKRRETFNYCLGCLNQEISQQMTLKLTDPFILTNINTTKTSILLFMSRLVPDWSQVKPGNPGAPVTHKSHLYLEIRDEQRTKWQADTGQEVPVGSRSRYYVRMVISLDIITAVLWDSVDKTDLRSSIPRWVWQRWHSKGPGGSCPALKINWLMIQIFMLSLSLSLIKTIP